MGAALLEVERATVRFGAVTAVAGVDLTVEPGCIVAVLGPSGSGKSTLLRAVAGLQPLDAGRILLDGRDLAGVPPHQRGLGLMFQDHALFPHRSVSANVGFGLRMQRRPAEQIEARVGELLDAVGLGDAAGRSVATLSGGEQQRVALARALAPAPQLLMLDEPLGSLDRPLRERLVRDLRSVFRELRQTVVAVTHDHAEAFALADELAVMSGGAMLQVGPAEQVWQNPTSPTVARVLGFTNLVDVEVEAGRAHTPWGDVAVPGTDRGRRCLLVRADAVRLDPNGPIAGVIRERTLTGRDMQATVQVERGPDLEVSFATGRAPAIGEHVRLAIDDAGVVVLGSDEP